MFLNIKISGEKSETTECVPEWQHMEKEEKTRRDGGEEREKLPGERTDAPWDPRSTSATSGAV